VEFARTEEQHYQGAELNSFTLALSQVQRYEFFLRTILHRYDRTATLFTGAITRRQNLAKQREAGHDVTLLEAELLRQIENLSPYIQLESESFYLFAKILLDRMAKFIEEYFRPAPSEKDLQRGYTAQGSHNRFNKQFGNYATRRGLTLPATFLPLARQLQEEISDFRDKHITHNIDTRTLHATAFSIDGSDFPRMMKARNSSAQWDHNAKQVESVSIHALMRLLDKYFDAFFALIVVNREVSAFARMNTPPAAL